MSRSAFGFVRAVGAAGLGNGAEARLLQVAVFALPVLAGLACGSSVLSGPTVLPGPTGPRLRSAALRAASGSCALSGLVLVALAICALALGSAGGAGPWLGTVVGTLSAASGVLLLVNAR